MMPELTGLSREFGERLTGVLTDERFEELTEGEAMDILSRVVATFLASSANTAADRMADCARDGEFRQSLTNDFGAFALMLANQVFVAASHGPLQSKADTVTADWLRRQMEEGGNAAA